MCSTHDYEHLMVPKPAPEPRVWVAKLDDAAIMAERARLRAMAGLPKVEDAFTFARSLRVVR